MCTRPHLQTIFVVIAVVGLTLIASVSASAKVYAWGRNDDFQLALTHTISQSTPIESSFLTGLDISKLVAGENFALALGVNGTVWAWGNNEFGQCGDDPANSPISTPKQVIFSATEIVDIAAGELSSFALTSSGDVFSWGWGQYGALGHGTNNSDHIPKKINGLVNVKSIFSHSRSSFAIDNDGSVFAWGANSDGQLCLGTKTDTLTPQKLSIGNGTVTLIAPGFTHTLILVGTQTLFSCGSRDQGELGRDADDTNSTTVGAVNITLDSNEAIRSLSAGLSTSFASTSNNKVFAWGNNEEDELGLGHNPAEPIVWDPTQIPAVSGKGGQISTGEIFSVLLTDESQRFAYSWGNESSGELGRDTQKDIPMQIKFTSFVKLVQMSAGFQFAFAIECACLNGGECISDNAYVCQCPSHRNGSICEGCNMTCGVHGNLNPTTCACHCIDGYSGTDCNEEPAHTSSSSQMGLDTLFLTLGATIAISLPLAILFIVIVLITIVVLVMYMRKSDNNSSPKPHRLYDNGNNLEMKDSSGLNQPLASGSNGQTAGANPFAPPTNLQTPPIYPTPAAPAPDGSKVIGGWRFAADFEDDDDWVRTVDSHSIELSSPDLASPFVKVPPAPLVSIRDIGFEENLNPRHRQTMEDGHCMIDGFGGVPTTGYFGIYDGHGGTRCVEFVQSRFHTIIQEELERTPNDVKDVFKRAYARMDKMLEEKMGGSTSITVLIRTEIDTMTGAPIRKLYSANCGDARTVLCRGDQAIRITRDHKASEEQDDAEEAERIRAAGGFIARGRVNGVLAVTRSLGDHSMKTWIISDPYQTEWTLSAADTFLVLACDGLWDVMKDQEVVDLVRAMRSQSSNAQAIAAAIVKSALDKKTKDNVSVMVVFL